MRQLLQSLDSTHVIAGLNDCAVVISNNNSLTELERPETPPDAPKAEPGVNPAEIQAVAATATSGTSTTIWYAVARYDKSLALYRDTDTKPTLVHKTARRASALCFCQVAADLTVVVAADLAGDATAFSLSSGDDQKQQQQRLLAGHTASMLTGVRVQNGRLFTADRDEKIRISSFPDTHIVQGYLLGHTAFVSCFDVMESHVVSGSGDGTVRLWDILTQKEVACYRATQDTSSDNEAEKESEESPSLIPTCVQWDSTGDFVAVCYENSNYLDLLQVQGQFLSRCCRIQCTAQPLGISRYGDNRFVVLVRDPAYLEVYQVRENELVVAAESLFGVFKDFRKIEMPTSILERDKHGDLKMTKENEKRGPAHAKTWNDTSRKETARERNRRFNKRKRGKQDSSDNPAET